MNYATRINSFLRTGKTVPEALQEIGGIDGVDYVDLNYPEHFSDCSVERITQSLAESGLRLNAINLRFRDQFLHGAFSHPGTSTRADAVTLCKEASAMCDRLGGRQIIVWLGFDGFDYSFQEDYTEAWRSLVECFREVCLTTTYPVSVEYKPYEERVHALIESWGSAWLMVKEVGCDNFGVTLDFCHMLMKKENPAFAASLLLEQGKLFTMHLNDGEGSNDDGLIVGSVHPWKTLELFYYLKKYKYNGIIYFDTFPKREDAAAECRANVSVCRKMEQIVERMGVTRIGDVTNRHDGVAVMELLTSMF